jgi:hypothetical protein
MQRWHQMTDEERKKFKEGLMGFRSWHDRDHWHSEDKTREPHNRQVNTD